MTNKIKFQFDDKLPHQIEAIKSTVSLFDGLPKQLQGLYAGKKLLAGDESRNPRITMGSRMLENLRGLQLQNHIFTDDALYKGNFGIEMETGTGKTYVYLRTILDLYRTYGFKKFMIVVPSIAIRKGVEKSLSMLKDHLKTLYNLDITKHSFVYESIGTQMTGFIESRVLQICVINTQAFAADRTKIKNADESGHVIWEELKEINPIVILDEPQRIEGTKKKPSKSIKAINELSPLFILKYSATHKKEFPFNMIYKLDSFDAFQQDLVKRIKVKTVYGVIPRDFPYIRYMGMTRDLKAKLEIFKQEQGGKVRMRKVTVMGGASLHELSGGLTQYAGMRIAENPHKKRPLKIATDSGFMEMESGECNKEVTQEKAVEIQIELAIEAHLEKQFEILDSGERVKALSLFFIDAVDKVRSDDPDDDRGEYLRIFDETYRRIIQEEPWCSKFERYKDLFPDYQNVARVREGYFARDRNNAVQEVQFKKNFKPGDENENNKYIKKSQEEIDRGIELILEKKDELISFKEPLAFIFSHSALREGWDNPNIFTLCTLKSSHSEIAKKQEIGRGLRLPVDMDGRRIKSDALNELTVIANDHYDHFAEALQTDFNESMDFNPEEVTAEILTGVLHQAGIPVAKITPDLVNDLKKELQKNNIITDKNVLSKDLLKKHKERLEKIEFTNETLKEHAAKVKESFVDLMQQKGSKRLPITNGDDPPVENREWRYISEEGFMKIVENLRHKLMKRAIYRFDLDQNAFIDECIREINGDLKHRDDSLTYHITEGNAGFTEAQKFQLKSTGIKERAVAPYHTGDRDNGTHGGRTDLEIVDDIMYHTMLPRLAIMRIIRGIEKRKMLHHQDTLERVTRRISRLLKDRKAESISAYEVIDGYELDGARIFEADIVDEALLTEEKHAWKYYRSHEAKRKAMHAFYRMDSKGEHAFAQHLENDNNVFLFTKLKKGGFVIDTPYGNYSPDWAIVCRNPGGESWNGNSQNGNCQTGNTQSGNCRNGNIRNENTPGTQGKMKLYFIIETKADKEQSDLTGVEQNKIQCGKLHFKAVSDDIRFDWVNSYNDFRGKFGVKN
ncbi:MAG: DEAD/DEAH box helicase family protein [Desulfamplus sp.]|nr:DEAD/DEAH box helicase family protein [Desulfamplus sp.]